MGVGVEEGGKLEEVMMGKNGLVDGKRAASLGQED